MIPRSLLAILALCLLSAAPARASALDAAFDILRKGEPIGYHVVTVDESD